MLTNEELCVLLRAFKTRLECDIGEGLGDRPAVRELVAKLDAAIALLEAWDAPTDAEH